MYTSNFLLSSLQVLSAAAAVIPRATTDSFPAQSSSLPSTGAPEYNWQQGYQSEYTIHASCNATERHEITEGLRQAIEMAEHAKNHILVHGNNSDIFQKYFGKGPTAPPVGWFSKVVSGNRAGVIFRCDDPDRNCATQNNWAGHWRGSNASAETVICPRSYQVRLPNTAMCARGFTVARGRPADFWGPDLLHRLFHVPLVGEGIVEHYADGYKGVQELASGANYTWAGHNSATLTYFATEVYAHDIAVPGEGCVGRPDPNETVAAAGHGAAAAPASSSSTTTTSRPAGTPTAAPVVTSVNPTRVVSQTPSPAQDASKECHTHADGVIHCV